MNKQQADDLKNAFRAHLNGKAPPGDLVGCLASEVVPERVTWLWSGRLALGKISMLDGNPGLGKSTLLLDIASRVSTGAPFPGQFSQRPAAGVVVLSAEDGVADTIVPRLKEAGANLSRVFILRGILDSTGTELGITIPSNLGMIAQALVTMGAQLLVMDPLMAYFGSEINANKDQDVRRALAPLASVLEEHACAAWLVRHLTKAESKEALYRGGGSIGIIGAARFGSIVARDPDNDEARIVASEKCNIGPEPPSLRYRLVGVEGTDVAKVVWDDDPVRWTAEDLLDAAVSDEEKEERSESEQWLYELLAAGPITVEEAVKLGRKASFSDKTLKRAKAKIGGKSRREGGVGSDGHWVWYLPSIAKGDTFPNTRSLRPLSTLGDPYVPLSNSSSSYVKTLRDTDGPLSDGPSAKGDLTIPKEPNSPKGTRVKLSKEPMPWDLEE